MVKLRHASYPAVVGAVLSALWLPCGAQAAEAPAPPPPASAVEGTSSTPAAPQTYAPDFFAERWTERREAQRMGDAQQVSLLLQQVVDAKGRSLWPSLPTYARALVYESRQARAQGDSAQALMLATAATRLAPQLPDAHVALAMAAWGQGNLGAAAHALLTASGALWRDGPTRQTRMGLLGLSLMLALVGTSLAFAMVQLLRYARPWLHDLNHRLPWPLHGWQAAASLAAVFAAPALLRLGPAWTVLVWLLLLASHFSRRERGTAMVLVVALASTSVLLPWAARAVFFSGSRAESRYLALSDPEARAAAQRLQRVPNPQPLELYALGLRARWSGDLGAAEALWRRALDAGLGGAEGHIALGNLAAARGDLPAAVHAFSDALKLQPDSALARLSYQRAAAAAAPGSVPALRTAGPQLAAAVHALENEALRRGALVLEAPLPPGLMAPDLWPVDRRLHAQLWRPWGGPLPVPLFLAACALVLARLVRSARRRPGPAFACSRCGDIACPQCSGTLADAVLCPGCHALAAYPDAVDATLRLRKEIAGHRHHAYQASLRRTLAVLVAGPAQLLQGAPIVGTLLLGTYLLAWVLLGWGTAWQPDLAPAYATMTGPLRGAALSLLLAVYLVGHLHLRRQES